MSSLVTIDYDFFTPHEMFSDVKMPNGTTMPGMLVYDWQMDENRGPIFDAVIWEIRCSNFKRWGLDIVAKTAPQLSVEDFATKLSMKMDEYSSPLCWRSDSHAWAGLVIKDFSERHGPLSVVNFDAHHDLGYNPAALDPFIAKGNVHCDNWALIGLRENWIENYTVVYPDWLGLAEWSEGVEKLTEDFKEQITTTTWSDWLAAEGEISEVEAMHFCRSSAWVPPWLDPGFEKLHEEFGWSMCLDCAKGQRNSPHDTCHPRAWDWEAVNESIRERTEHFNTLQAMIDAEKLAEKL